jgi:hypothetical protein
MRRTIVLLVLCGAAAGIAAAIARPGLKSAPAPSLRIAVANPLVVTGRNFRPHERLRVIATVAGEKRTRTLTAGRTGRLRVELYQLGASRCDSIRIVAVRRSGRLVVVKRLPAPACSTS